MSKIQVLTILVTLTAGNRPPLGTPHKAMQPDQVKMGTATTRNEQQWAQFRGRFVDEKHQRILSGMLWSVIHAAESKEKLDKFLGLLESIGSALKSDSPALLKDVGGVNGFKDRPASLAKSDDDAIGAGAAIMLGICGDQSYASDLADLMKKSDPPVANGEEYYRRVTVRGRAAMALGLLGAKQYAPDLAALLHSKNEYDQAGAAMGLGYLGDRSKSKAVAALLDVTSLADSAIHSLLLMGAGTEYADDIARVLRRGPQGQGEPAETAAYALAVVGAKDHARDIAGLLSQEFAKGYAAKALALMGATEYAKEIAPLLADPDNRGAAALALGIMGSTQYAAALAKLLKDQEESVQYDAAVALVLMQIHDYDRVAVQIIERFHSQGYYLNEGDLDSIAHDRFLAIKARLEEFLAKIRKQARH